MIISCCIFRKQFTPILVEMLVEDFPQYKGVMGYHKIVPDVSQSGKKGAKKVGILCF